MFLDGFLFFFFFQSYSMVADFVALVIFEVCHLIFLVEKMFAGAVGIFDRDCKVVCGSKVSSFQLKVWNFGGEKFCLFLSDALWFLRKFLERKRAWCLGYSFTVDISAFSEFFFCLVELFFHSLDLYIVSFILIVVFFYLVDFHMSMKMILMFFFFNLWG